jgi:molecular chaperone GrpE
MAVRKKITHRNGGTKATMQPEKDNRGSVPAQAKAATEADDLEALETITGELDAATTCETEPEQAERAAAQAQTAQAALAEALAAANARVEEYLNLAQRVQADFDNFRRRNQNVRSEAYEDGARAFITTLLPVLDNLERAIGAADSSGEKSLLDGVEMVRRQLADALDKRGVTPIDRKGEKFDPSLENAVMRGNPEDGEPGTVCEVLQKGYQMGGFVLRHAMVKVVPD